MPRLVAKDLARYNSRDLKPGDEFDATENDAFVLKKIGKAVDAPATDAAEREELPMNGVDEREDIGLASNKRRPRGTYNRRDMRAND